MKNFSEEKIANKIKNKELLSRDEYDWIVFECSVYKKEGYRNGQYQYNFTLSKLDSTYTLVNWSKDLTGNNGTIYEYPIIVTDIKTTKVQCYRHIISLEDGSSYTIETSSNMR